MRTNLQIGLPLPQRKNGNHLSTVCTLVKVNCDGARFAEENRAGIGVVIRNSEGLVLGSLSKLVPQAYGPLEIEDGCRNCSSVHF